MFPKRTSKSIYVKSMLNQDSKGEYLNYKSKFRAIADDKPVSQQLVCDYDDLAVPVVPAFTSNRIEEINYDGDDILDAYEAAAEPEEGDGGL
jgi:hypothetical protein